MKIKKITKKDSIKTAIEKNPLTKKILLKEGLYCAECPMASYETIEEGSRLHGVNPEDIIRKINGKSKKLK